jgi:hypothetical protein
MPTETLFKSALLILIAAAIAGCSTTAPSPDVALASTPPRAEPVLVPSPEPTETSEVETPAKESSVPPVVEEKVVEPNLMSPVGESTSPEPVSATPSEVQSGGVMPAVKSLPAPEAPVLDVVKPSDPTTDVAGKAAEPAEKDAPSLSFLRPGETLVFKMNWGILSNIGETRIETIEESVDGSRRFRIRIATKSRGLLDAIYPVVNDSESVIERSTGRPLEISVEGKSGKRPTRTHTVFDYEAGQIVHTDHIRPHRSGTTELPPEPAYDLMVAMLKSREWGFQPGDTREVLTAFEDEFYFITVTAHRREKVKTGAGTFDAVMLEPTQIGEQKGFFRKGGSMRYWISEGPNPQVVKMVFKTKAGTLTALLEHATVTE